MPEYSGNRRQINAKAPQDCPKGELPLRGLTITAEPETGAGAYVVHVGAGRLGWKPSDNSGSIASVYILAVSLDAQGHMIAHTLHGMSAHARPGAALNDPAKMADFEFAVQPAPKAATLRFIVRDNSNSRMGSVDLPRKED